MAKTQRECYGTTRKYRMASVNRAQNRSWTKEMEKMSGDVQGALTTHGTVEGLPIFHEGGHLRSIAHSEIDFEKNKSSTRSTILRPINTTAYGLHSVLHIQTHLTRTLFIQTCSSRVRQSVQQRTHRYWVYSSSAEERVGHKFANQTMPPLPL